MPSAKAVTITSDGPRTRQDPIERNLILISAPWCEFRHQSVEREDAADHGDEKRGPGRQQEALSPSRGVFSNREREREYCCAEREQLPGHVDGVVEGFLEPEVDLASFCSRAVHSASIQRRSTKSRYGSSLP